MLSWTEFWRLAVLGRKGPGAHADLGVVTLMFVRVGLLVTVKGTSNVVYRQSIRKIQLCLRPILLTCSRLTLAYRIARVRRARYFEGTADCRVRDAASLMLLMGLDVTPPSCPELRGRGFRHGGRSGTQDPKLPAYTVI